MRIILASLLLFSFLFLQILPRDKAESFRNKVISKFESTIKSKGWEVIGTGGSIQEDRNTLIGVRISFDGYMNLECARLNAINSLDLFLEAINNADSARKLVNPYPLPSEKVEIFFISNDDRAGKEDEITGILIGNDNIMYRANIVNNQRVTVLMETVGEARAILASKNTNTQQQSH